MMDKITERIVMIETNNQTDEKEKDEKEKDMKEKDDKKQHKTNQPPQA